MAMRFISLRIEKEIIDRIKKRSVEQKLSRSEVIRRILKKDLLK